MYKSYFDTNSLFQSLFKNSMGILVLITLSSSKKSLGFLTTIQL